MHAHAKRLVGLSLAPLLSVCLLVGCGGGPRPDDGRASNQSMREQERRARQVADSWEGSAAAVAWREGYYPMADAVRIPESGWRGAADEQAYENKNFVLRGDLPTAASATGLGTVDWGNGVTLTRPLWDARRAYQSLALNHGDGPRLTVTGAGLGNMRIRTSRGTATVPAWLFTLEGYDTPLKRVAVTPSTLPDSPIKGAEEGAAGGLWRVARLAGTAKDGRSLTVRATSGSCDKGPVVNVLETDENVVLYASVAGARKGPCTAGMTEQNVKVQLRKPLGDRILLDTLTSRPVPYGEPAGPSPSWT
ncbi:hypothetical protein [Streptomyces sp. NPDC088725]|uniref:hypothetical protein n=1 Tax=Streptomyces sp. NPDC088725 TaxID=3365873 RepID=UPI0038036175